MTYAHRRIAVSGLAFVLPLITALWAACGLIEIVPSPVYDHDGVPVYVANGKGPSEPAMRLAIELYRYHVIDYLEITLEDESGYWHALTSIHWTGDTLPGGGSYDRATASIRLQYTGCAVDGPLYRSLLAHYHMLALGTDALADEDLAWAEALSHDYAPAICAI